MKPREDKGCVDCGKTTKGFGRYARCRSCGVKHARSGEEKSTVYGTIHDWVRDTFGRPDHCELCGRTEKRRYEWSSKTHKHLRERSDWQQVCVPCHRKYDIAKGFFTPKIGGRKFRKQRSRSPCCLFPVFEGTKIDMTEYWKSITGYEGLYEVSSLGRFRALRKTKGNNSIQKEKLLKPQVKANGYQIIGLWKNSKCYTRSAHRIVAEAFIENPDGKPDINHKNGVHNDNRVANLEWCTPSENLKHAFDVLGHKTWNKGLKTKPDVKCGWCKKKFYLRKRSATFCSKSCAMYSRNLHLKENKLI